MLRISKRTRRRPQRTKKFQVRQPRAAGQATNGQSSASGQFRDIPVAQGFTERGSHSKLKTIKQVGMPGGYADRALVTLKWAYSTNLTLPANLIPAQFGIRGNGPYDPWSATGGTQPVNYDDWSAIYAQYKVLSCRIMVRFNSPGTLIQAAIVPTLDSVVSFNTFDEAVAQPFVTVCEYGAQQGTWFGNTMDTAKLFGQSRTQFTGDNEEFAAVVTGVPNSQWYWTVTARDPSSAGISLVPVEIMVEYKTLFYDRQTTDIDLTLLRRIALRKSWLKYIANKLPAPQTESRKRMLRGIKLDVDDLKSVSAMMDTLDQRSKDEEKGWVLEHAPSHVLADQIGARTAPPPSNLVPSAPAARSSTAASLKEALSLKPFR